jgi:hypothetical protein
MNFNKYMDVEIDLQPDDVSTTLLFEIVEEFTNYLIDNIKSYQKYEKADELLKSFQNKLNNLYEGQTK